MAIAYDAYTLNHQILLDLTLEEAIGGRAHDRSKGHRWLTLNGPPTWTQMASRLTVLDFGGAADYLDCPNADTADLEFTSGDYSIAGWINWSAGVDSQIVIGRYAVDVGGWELYLYNPTNLLTLRHHHAGGAAARSAVYSAGWTQSTLHFMGVCRSGNSATFYRNGVPLAVTGVLEDAEATVQDLVIGTRFTKDANWFNGQMWRPRVWGRELQEEEMKRLFDLEKNYLGV